MRCSERFLKITCLWILMLRVLAGRGRFKGELGFMHCLCETTVPFRLQRIQCMEQFVTPGNTYTLSQSVQYCGYFVNKTNFGQTVRQRIHIPDYNPWQPATDLNTDISCSYTRIKPGNAAVRPSIYFVTGKGWIISRCILNMAFIDAVRTDVMLKTCCR